MFTGPALFATVLCLGMVAGLAAAIKFHKDNPEKPENKPQGFRFEEKARALWAEFKEAQGIDSGK